MFSQPTLHRQLGVRMNIEPSQRPAHAAPKLVRLLSLFCQTRVLKKLTVLLLGMGAPLVWNSEPLDGLREPLSQEPGGGPVLQSFPAQHPYIGLPCARSSGFQMYVQE